MTTERSTFDKQQGKRKDFWIYKGIAYEEEVSKLLASMMDDFPANVIAFDHQIVPSGNRFMVTVMVQVKNGK